MVIYWTLILSSEIKTNMDSELNFLKIKLILYYLGYGNIKQNGSRALDLALESAEHDYLPELQNLSLYYYKGTKGIPKDWIKGYKWSYIGSKYGNPVAVQNIDFFNANMSSSDIEKAKAEAEKWMNTHKVLNTSVESTTGSGTFDINSSNSSSNNLPVGYSVQVQSE